jgi:heme exporter protein D
MYFDSLRALIFMEGHGAYVWSAYGISLLVLALVLVGPWRRRRRVLAQVGANLRREAARAAREPVHASGT